MKQSKKEEHFTIKIPPTMAYVLEEQGELNLELDGKLYKLISEEKFNQALDGMNEKKIIGWTTSKGSWSRKAIYE